MTIQIQRRKSLRVYRIGIAAKLCYNYTSSNRINSRSDADNVLRPDTRKVRFLMHPHSTRTPFFPQNLDDYAPWVAKHGLTAPYGECQCGCGQATSLAPYARPNEGYRKGDPIRFVRGHINGAKQTIEEAFWQYVIAGNLDDCWEWQGPFRTGGYGTFRFKGRPMNAHRVSYEVHFGAIPDELFACHKCDNPPCCNPFHLFLGTDADNCHDRMIKGRNAQLKGEAHPRAKLSWSDVESIRKMGNSGLFQKEIAKQFGISRSVVSAILRGESWR